MAPITYLVLGPVYDHEDAHVVMLTDKPLNELHAEYNTYDRLTPRPARMLNFGEWLIERGYARDTTDDELVVWYKPA